MPTVITMVMIISVVAMAMTFSPAMAFTMVAGAVTVMVKPCLVGALEGIGPGQHRGEILSLHSAGMVCGHCRLVAGRA